MHPDEVDKTAPDYIPTWTDVLDNVELIHPIIRVLLRYRDMIRVAIRGVGLYGLILGAGTWIGGDIRMMGPSYRTTVDFAEAVGGAPAVVWGASAFVFGVLALAPFRKASMCGLFGIVVWSAFLAISHLVSANIEPLAGVSGIFGHGFISLVVLGLFVVRMVDRKI